MLPGLNHNVRYKERLFHVQTEDSGLDRPVLMTHVFIDGSIIATEKSDYRELLANFPDDDVARKNAIRKQMQEQHKFCIKNLLRGTYDPVIAQFIPEIEALPPALAEPPPPRRSSIPPLVHEPVPTPPLASSRPPMTGPPIVETPPVPMARRSSVPPMRPTGGVKITSTGSGTPRLPPDEESAPTERPRSSHPIFDELEVPLLDPSAFADEEEILRSLDSLPPLPDDYVVPSRIPHPEADPSDTLLDLPAFDFAEDDDQPLRPLPHPDPVLSDRPPTRADLAGSNETMYDPLPPEARAEIARQRRLRGEGGLPTTPAPPGKPSSSQRPQTRPPSHHSGLVPPPLPSSKPGEPATRLIDRREKTSTPIKPSPQLWPETPEPARTHEFQFRPTSSPPGPPTESELPVRSSGELPAFPMSSRPPQSLTPDSLKTSPDRRRLIDSDDIPKILGTPEVPRAPHTWPPRRRSDVPDSERETIPPPSDIPDFLGGRGSGSQRPKAGSGRPRKSESQRPIRAEEQVLDDIIQSYLDTDD